MILILPDRNLPRKTFILPEVPKFEWRSPSQSVKRDWLGNEIYQTRFRVTARLNDGFIVWRGWFDDRDDADAFFWGVISGSIRQEPYLWDLPTPCWCPDMAEHLVYDFATVSFILNGTTSWSVPSDWDNSNNSLECMGGGGNGSVNPLDPGGGGGGGAYSKVVNQTYTPGASRTVAVGAVAGDTSIKQDNNSTTAVLAKGGTSAVNTPMGQAGGSSASGTGSTKYSGGNGSSAAAYAGAGGGCAGPNGAGNNASSTTSGAGDNSSGGAAATVGNNGNPGTEFDATHGCGSGGGGSNSGNGKTGGLYGGAGGGAYSGTGGAGRNGLIVITYTPAVKAYGFNLAMMGM